MDYIYLYFSLISCHPIFFKVNLKLYNLESVVRGIDGGLENKQDIFHWS